MVYFQSDIQKGLGGFELLIDSFEVLYDVRTSQVCYRHMANINENWYLMYLYFSYEIQNGSWMYVALNPSLKSNSPLDSMN